MEYELPLKIAVAGNVDAGKSTFVGVLKTGKFDNGDGDLRKDVFNFPHERESGRTSSISQQTVLVNGKKIILVDTCGHERYLKTTVFGISAHHPDLILILVEGNKGVQKMTREHMITAIYLEIPIIILMTKIDVVQTDKLEKNIDIVKKIFKSAHKTVHEVKSKDDVLSIADLFEKESDKIIPLFKISNVKGNTIDPPFDYVITFLDRLNNKKRVLEDEESLFVMDKSFTCKGYPLVASGYMKKGSVNTNEKLFLGPVNDNYIDIVIRTIHDDDRTNVDNLKKEELGCVSIKAKGHLLRDKYDIRPGMVITNVKIPFVKKFIGEISVFSTHSSTISVGYNTVIHLGAIKKTAKISKIHDKNDINLECIRGGSKNVFVEFEFVGSKQYVLVGDKFIFREGNTRGFGTVRKITL